MIFLRFYGRHTDNTKTLIVQKFINDYNNIKKYREWTGLNSPLPRLRSPSLLKVQGQNYSNRPCKKIISQFDFFDLAHRIYRPYALADGGYFKLFLLLLLKILREK